MFLSIKCTSIIPNLIDFFLCITGKDRAPWIEFHGLNPHGTVLT